MKPSIKRLVECERVRFSINEYRGLSDAPPFTIAKGTVPALVSAPHAVTHTRNGRIKASEDFTGPIVLEVAKATGAHAIVATRFDESDANHDPLELSAYKQSAVDCVRQHDIKLVIDVHGMVTASPAIIALGTGDGANVAAWPEVATLAAGIIEDHVAPFARKHDKPIVCDGRYAAREENTLAATIARHCGVAALQIELSTLLRFPGGIKGHTPPGECNPFPKPALAPELSARANPDPAAVEAAIATLADIVRLACS